MNKELIIQLSIPFYHVIDIYSFLLVSKEINATIQRDIISRILRIFNYHSLTFQESYKLLILIETTKLDNTINIFPQNIVFSFNFISFIPPIPSLTRAILYRHWVPEIELSDEMLHISHKTSSILPDNYNNYFCFKIEKVKKNNLYFRSYFLNSENEVKTYIRLIIPREQFIKICFKKDILFCLFEIINNNQVYGVTRRKISKICISKEKEFPCLNGILQG